MLIWLLLCGIAFSEATYCASPREDTLYIYPSNGNCSTFIACVDNEEIEFECLDAPLFEHPEKVCVEECSKVATTRRTGTKSAKFAELPEDPLLYPQPTSRTIVCPPEGQTKAVIPQSCTDYISCDNGIGTKLTCSDGNEFSRGKFECVERHNSDCSVKKERGSYHTKCRYYKDGTPIYFSSDSCNEFKKCANQLAWEVPCARYCFWDNKIKSCNWASHTECAGKKS